MFAQVSLPPVRLNHLPKRVLATAVTAVMLAAGVVSSGTAHAASTATVANFCAFSRSVGRVYTGRTRDGQDYAAWTYGTRYFNVFAFDTNSDTHVDLVVYAPYYNGEYHLQDIGVCSGPDRNVWYNAAAIERRYQRGLQAQNEAWSEMGPSMVFGMEIEALDDATM
jgi:hypothetical protein